MVLQRTQHRTAEGCLDCQVRAQRPFCDLSPEALAAFDALGASIAVPRDAILFEQEAPAASVLVICEGQVKLSCSSRDGRTLLLRVARAGDVLGLSAALACTPHEVTARALVPTKLKSIRRDHLLAFLNRHGEASMHAAEAVSGEYRSVFLDARRLALAPSAGGRLASVLLELEEAAAVKPGLPFIMALTHEDLASYAGIARETVTRTLGGWRRGRLIQVRGASMRILAPQRLAALTT